MKNNLFKVGVTILVGLSTSCSSNYFGNFLSRTGTNDPVSVTQECANSGDCTIQNTYSPQESSPGKYWPEIAFIGDTSGSMASNYAALTEALPTWIEHLQSNGLENFCVGFIPAHAGQYSGLYYAPDGYPKCMCTDTYDVGDASTPNTIVYNLTYILNHFPTSDESTNGDPVYSQNGEVSLYSLHNAITVDSNIAANQAAGCMQDTYTFAPILVADENDISSAINGPDNSHCVGKTVDGVDMGTIEFDNSLFPEIANGYSTDKANDGLDSNFIGIPDETCQEPRGRFKYYSFDTPNADGKYELKINHQTVADELVSFNGVLPSFGDAVGFIAGQFPNGNPTGQDSQFVGGDEFADIFGNKNIANLKFADTNQTQFEAELNKIADAMAKTITFIYVFDLVDEDGNPAAVCEDEVDNVVVKVNGETVDPSDYSLNASLTRVTFAPDYEWTLGAVVTIYFSTCSE